MGFKDLIRTVAKMNTDDRPVVPDDVTTDKFLKSLRRQRRIQMEELEKKKLLQDIAKFEKRRTQKELFGIKGKIEKKPQFSKPKQVSMFDSKGMLGKSQDLRKKIGKKFNMGKSGF